MKWPNINITGLSKVWWADSGILKRDDGYQLVYSGGKKHEHRVGILADKKAAKVMPGHVTVNERIMMMMFAGKPFKYNIIQVSMLTSDYADDEVEEIYEQVNQLMRKSKNDETTTVIGDMNSKVGCKREDLTIGPFGLGEKNECGDCMVEFCKSNKLIVNSTWFKMYPRRLYTWQSPFDDVKNQIDYTLVPECFRNVNKKVKTYLGADCFTDHNLLVMNIVMKLKSLQKFKRESKLNLEELEIPA